VRACSRLCAVCPNSETSATKIEGEQLGRATTPAAARRALKTFIGELTAECIGNLKTPPARRQRALYTVNLEERREGEPVTLGALASVAAVHHLVADDHRHTRLEHRVHCRRLGPLHRVADHVRLKAARRFRPREGLVGLQLVPKRGREAHAARPRPGGREGLGWDEG
jgi:hypothetical protein